MFTCIACGHLFQLRYNVSVTLPVHASTQLIYFYFCLIFAFINRINLFFDILVLMATDREGNESQIQLGCGVVFGALGV